MTPEQAADFVSRYCGVGFPEELLREKPTWPQLREARAVGHRTVDRALAVLRVHHGIEHEENFLAPQNDPTGTK